MGEGLQQEVGWPVVVTSLVMIGAAVGGWLYCTAAPSGRPPQPISQPAHASKVDPLCAQIVQACPRASRTARCTVEMVESKYPRLGAMRAVHIGDARWYVADDGTLLTSNGPSIGDCPGMPNVTDEVRVRARKAAAATPPGDPGACSAEDLAIADDLNAELARTESDDPEAMERAEKKAFRAVAKRFKISTDAVVDVWAKTGTVCPEAL